MIPIEDSRETLLMIPADHGTLAVWIGEPAGETNTVAILWHGLGTDHHEDRDESQAGVFDHLVPQFLNGGVATIRPDASGHGRSSGSIEGYSFSTAERDAIAVWTVAQEHFRGKPTVLVGASFGAVSIQKLIELGSPAIIGTILYYPLLDAEGIFCRFESPWAATALGPSRRRGNESVDLGDGIVVGPQLFDEAAGYLDLSASFAAAPGELIVIHGTADSYSPFSWTKTLIMAKENASLISVTGAEHGFGDDSLRQRLACCAAVAVDLWTNAPH